MARESKAVYFAHGKESGPWGKKITALAEVARDHSFAVHSPDYQGIDNPQARVAQLLELKPDAETLVLVGSSMGGYVSAFAAEQLQPAAMLLMAPALYMPYPNWDGEPVIPTSTRSVVVHGWRDAIIPPSHAIRFAERNDAALHVFNADHGLTEVVPQLQQIFSELLRDLY